jgi:lipopolysaccharide biosynthesis glycosyltransferase
MRILLTFDTGYAPHAATVMESIIQNCPEKLDFVVIYYDLNKEMQDVLSKHFLNKVKSLEFVRLDEEILRSSIKNMKTAEHLKGFHPYLRLFSSELLPYDEYVIYLDCDIIVQDNILNILNDADLSMPLCAVTEYNPDYKWQDLSRFTGIGKIKYPWVQEAYWYRAYQSLEMDATSSYFNTGVMVVNLEYWRKYKIAEKAIVFLLNNPEKCYAADQDALNHVINGNYYVLASHWNTVASLVLSGYTEQQLRKTHKTPSIIHTVGGIKSWHYMCSVHNAKKLYRQYRKLTPYPKINYTDKSLKNILKHQIILLLKLIIGKKIRVMRQNLIKEISYSKRRLKYIK